MRIDFKKIPIAVRPQEGVGADAQGASERAGTVIREGYGGYGRETGLLIY